MNEACALKEEFVEKINLLLAKYEDKLKEKGIKCTVSKKDMKIPVSNFFLNHGLLNSFFHNLTEKREKEFYHNKPDKIRTVILSFSPDDKKRFDSKDYALIVKSVSRIGKGFAPTTTMYNGEKLLKKAEKCIQKMLEKAEKEKPDIVCKSSFLDNLRYLLCEQYSYKKTVFGKSRDQLQLGVVILGFAILIALVVMFALV